MARLPELLVDLDAEYADARSLIDPLAGDAPEWDRPTPAAGWAVRDQISHLAFFDDAARSALVTPAEFATAADVAMSRPGDPMEEHLILGRSMDGEALATWWEEAHRGLTDALAGADPSDRIPWFGPPMGVLSFVSARLMETWAHAQDVADALDLEHRPTDRLRHVAHLGVRARPFSYLIHDRPMPPGHVAVSLRAPSGEIWSWEAGPVDGGEALGTIRGRALDFCLVVTQRRPLSDTPLVVDGEAAVEWMTIAQAFAGPPGASRTDGG
jgi:uncharacterized protein (TIGR03084 family)